MRRELRIVAGLATGASPQDVAAAYKIRFRSIVRPAGLEVPDVSVNGDVVFYMFDPDPEVLRARLFEGIALVLLARGGRPFTSSDVRTFASILCNR